MYVSHISNEEVRNRTRQAIGPHEDLLTTVKRRKLKWYGHVTRSTGLAKTILPGTVQGGRRRGRQKKRWEDNIPEWTGMTLGAAMRKAERRDEWRELVARSSVVPLWRSRTSKVSGSCQKVSGSCQKVSGSWRRLARRYATSSSPERCSTYAHARRTVA